MSLNVTLNLPAEIEEKLRRESPNLEAEVTEAYALELFRRGKLSHYELSRVLEKDRLQTDAWLKRHNVVEGSPKMADLEADRQTLERLMQKAR
jgi:predicted HTH domain antitoxin